MCLVEDQQAEAVTQPFDMAGGGIVGGDGEGLRFVVAAADQADLLVRERRPQQCVPLLHQVQGRDHDQPVASRPAQRQQPNQRFTCSGRQHHHPASFRHLPGCECFPLMWVGRHLQRAAQFPTLIAWCLVAGQFTLEGADDVAVAIGRCPVGVHARVVTEPGFQSGR